ncbi:MAG: dockerin type I repeat-containing protein [Ruminococcus sp.]|nr:dockerin type I repeat-containing protein [Ruminococcus sp.]
MKKFKKMLCAVLAVMLLVSMMPMASVAAASDDSDEVKVVGIEVTQNPYNMTCIEGQEYNTMVLDGLEVTLTLSDGAQAVWDCDSGHSVNGFYVTTSRGKDDLGNYYVKVNCYDFSETIYFEVVENPVSSISVYSASDLEYYKHSHGYIMNSKYDYFYEYEIPQDTLIQINYKDGSSKIASFYEKVDCYAFNDSSSQWTSPWGIGTNYVTISYLEVETQFPVTILDTPFESVELHTSPSRDYYFGDNNYGYVTSTDKYFLVPTDISGLSFTATFKDGSTKTYDEDDIDVENRTIDGYEYSVKECVVEGVGETVTILYFMGAEIEIPIKVAEAYIKSFEVIKAPDKTDYALNYFPDFTGMQVKVTYFDDTTKVVTANSDTLSYKYTDMGVYVQPFIICLDMGDEKLEITEIGYGYTAIYHRLSYRGYYIDYKGINYFDEKDTVNVEVTEFTRDGDGMKIEVEYADGTKDSLTYDTVLYLDETDDLISAYGLTENGLTSYRIEKLGEDRYKVRTFAGSTIVDCKERELGDVDGDGEVTIMDATAIQLHIAQLETIPEYNLACADADGDGTITIIDATQIQLYIAQLIPEL